MGIVCFEELEKVSVDQALLELKELMDKMAEKAMREILEYAKVLFGQDYNTFPHICFADGREDNIDKRVKYSKRKGISVAEGFGGDYLISANGDIDYKLVGYDEDRLFCIILTPDGLSVHPMHLYSMEPNLADGVKKADTELVMSLRESMQFAIKKACERQQRWGEN